MSMGLPVAGAVVVLTTLAIWLGSDWLEEASDRLSTYYGLPLVIQGAVVAAIGSSMPELAAVAVAAIVEGSLGLGVGAIVGSAIFNVLVIPALAGVATEDDVESSRALVYKEAQFYMLAVSVLLITFALAVIYYPAPDDGLSGTVTRPLAVIPLALYGLYIFIQAQDTADHTPDPAAGADVAVARQWGRLLAGLAIILVAVHFLVEAVASFGTAFGVDPFLMGATILAGATSLPDTLVSVNAARADRDETSLANVLGSNTFDLLVAIPVGIMLAGALPIDFAMAVPMFGVLTAATILLFTVLRTDLALTLREAYVLLVAYLLFVGWVIVEASDVVVGILPE